MTTKTWPYGTTRTAKVLENGNGFQILQDDTGEGHVLTFGAQDKNALVGDVGNLVFTKGGPTGGYWKFFVPQRSRLTKGQ